MACFFNKKYLTCECGNNRFEAKETVLLTEDKKEDDCKTVYTCTKCGKIIFSKNKGE